MSVYLHGLAMRADLSANLKLVLAALCDAAGEDDGTHCYPSVAYVTYKTGFSRRHTQRLIRTLEAARYIEPVAFSSGGRGHTTWYRIHIKRVPMKPDWTEVKRRLIEAGELAENDDIPPGAKPVGKRREGRKGDKMSPISENPVKGDKMSPFNPVKGDILSPFSEERATFCHPSILIETKDSYRDEDSYAVISPSENTEGAENPEPTEARWTHRPGDLPATRLWGQAVQTLGATTPAAQMASWIAPLRITRYGWDSDGALRVELAAPGHAHAEAVEQRFSYLIGDAIARAYHMPASRVVVSLICLPSPQVTRAAHATEVKA